MKSPRVASRWLVGVVAGISMLAQGCSSSSSPGGSPPSVGASATAPAGSSATSAPTPIDGMYSSGTSILTLKGGRWTRTLPDMAGTFSLSGHDLQLSDQPGCPGQGTYGWSLAHDLLTLTKVREACAQRDVQFIGVEKWSVVHRWGASLKNGQILLLGDGQHVARFDGQLDLAGLTKVSIEASLSIKNGLIFSPTVLTGAPGQTIAVTISNPRRHDTEDVGHTFTIDQLGIDADIAYGASTTVTVTLPQSGSLRFYCSIHANRNQQGEFLVNG